MPGFLLHVGATVLCAHGGQAQPTVPFPRVTVGGQPVVTQTAPYVDCRMSFPSPVSAWAVRNCPMDYRRNKGDSRRCARAAPGQPGDLCSHGHTFECRDDPVPGQRDVEESNHAN